MRDEHIKATLDGAPLDTLGEDELAAVRSHAAQCKECARALEAARVSLLLLKERAAAETRRARRRRSTGEPEPGAGQAASGRSRSP